MTPLRRSVAAITATISDVPAVRQAVENLFALHREVCFAQGWPAPPEEPYDEMRAAHECAHPEVRKAFEQLLVLSELSHAEEITRRVKAELAARDFVYNHDGCTT